MTFNWRLVGGILAFKAQQRQSKAFMIENTHERLCLYIPPLPPVAMGNLTTARKQGQRFHDPQSMCSIPEFHHHKTFQIYKRAKNNDIQEMIRASSAWLLEQKRNMLAFILKSCFLSCFLSWDCSMDKMLKLYPSWLLSAIEVERSKIISFNGLNIYRSSLISEEMSWNNDEN